MFQTILDKELDVQRPKFLHLNHLHTQPTGVFMDLFQAVMRTPKVPPACLPLPSLFLLKSVNKGGNRTGKSWWRTDRWGLHLSFQFMFTSVHAKKKKRKKNKKKKEEKKKVNSDRRKHHNTWHTRASVRGGLRVNYTHAARLRALGSDSRGPVLALTQIQSHTSTVHGTRGHLNTWSQ